MGTQGREDILQGGGWRTRWLRRLMVPHLHADKPGRTTGE